MIYLSFLYLPMAAWVVTQTQQVGETVVNTWVSVFQQLYNNPFIQGLISLLLAIFLSLVLIFVSKIIAVFIRNKIAKNFGLKQTVGVSKMGVLIGDVVFYCMSFISIYIAFTIAGINIGLLMWGITIGVWFAFRQTLSNMISWIVIYTTDEYKTGNIIQLKMQWDIFWVIEEINMKNVIIRTFDMRRVVVPNATFLKKAVKTYSAEEFLRLESDVILDIHCDAEIFMQGILEIVNEFPFVMNKQYTQVLLDGFDDKKIKFKVQLFYNPNGWYSSEYIQSMIQVRLLQLYKKLVFKKEA